MAFTLKTPGWLKAPAWMRGGPAAGRSSRSWLEPRYPSVAFDIDMKALAAVRIGRRKGESYIASFDVEDVPPDLIEMDFMRWKAADPERFRALVRRLVEKDPQKFNRASVIIPDNYARVALLPFEEMPRNRRDALELIRWKTKKTVPFRVEEAAVDYQVIKGAAGWTAFAVLTPRSVVEEVETLFEPFGVHAGLVDLSSLSLINLYRPVFEREGRDSTEFLLANVSGTYFSFAILRRGEIVFFRSKPLAVGTGDDGGEGSLRLLKRELQTSLVYYREKLEGKGLSCVYLRVVDHDPGPVASVFSGEAELGPVSMIDPRRVISTNGRFSGDHGERLLQRLAPALGATMGRASR